MAISTELHEIQRTLDTLGEYQRGKTAFTHLTGLAGRVTNVYTDPILKLPSPRDLPIKKDDRTRVFAGYVYTDVKSPAEYASLLAINAIRFELMQTSTQGNALYCQQQSGEPVFIYTEEFKDGKVATTSSGPRSSAEHESALLRNINLSRHRFRSRLQGFGDAANQSGEVVSAAVAYDVLRNIEGREIPGTDALIERLKQMKVPVRKDLLLNEPIMADAGIYSMVTSSAHGFADLIGSTQR